MDKQRYRFRLLLAATVVLTLAVGIVVPQDIAAADKEQTQGYRLTFRGITKYEQYLQQPIRQLNSRFFISLTDAQSMFTDIKFSVVVDHSILLQYPTFTAVLPRDSNELTLNGVAISRSGPVLTQLNGSAYIALGELAALLGQPITYESKSRTIVFDYQVRYESYWAGDKIGVWLERASGKLFMSQGGELPEPVAAMKRLGGDLYRIYAEQIAEDISLITILDEYSERSRTRVYKLLFSNGKLVRQTEEDYAGNYYITGTVRDGALMLLSDNGQLLWVRPDGAIEKQLDVAAAIGEQATVVYADQDRILFQTVAKQLHVLYNLADESAVLIYKELLPVAEQDMIEEYWARSDGGYRGDLLTFEGREGNTLVFRHRILFFLSYFDYYDRLVYTLG